MSIRYPDTNFNRTAGVYVRHSVPAGATTKPASTACVFGFFFRTRKEQGEWNIQYTMAARTNAGTGGNDAYWRHTRDATSFQAQLRNAGVTQFTGTVTGLALDTTYLHLTIVTSTSTYLVICEPGGTPTVVDTSSSNAYTTAMTSTQFLEHVNYDSVDPISDVFFLTGAWPVDPTSNTTLIEALADGSQDIDTLVSQLTSGTEKCWYPMTSPTDLSDAYGVAGDLTPVNVGSTVGRVVYPSGPLRPVGLAPAQVSDQVSQVVFGTAGDTSTALATIRTEGGAYNTTLLGGTPDNIQARLLEDDGSTLVDWTVVDASPSGNVWDAGELTSVPMTAGWLTLQFRARNSSGTQIGPIVNSHGLRGAGFSFVTQGQSQMAYLLAVGSGIDLATSARASVLQQPSTMQIVSNGDLTARRGRGVLRAVEEIHARFPNVPVQVANVAIGGQTLDSYGAGGTNVGVWSALASLYGDVVPNHYLVMMGHSSGPISGYETEIADVVSQAEASLGESIRIIQCPVPRYFGGDATTLVVRSAQRSWVANNPERGWWGGNWSVVLTSETGGSDPHPADSDAGQGRSGALLAWAVMMASRAVDDVPLKLSTATIDGTNCVLNFTGVNV